jgi:hypothetical protein
MKEEAKEGREDGRGWEGKKEEHRKEGRKVDGRKEHNEEARKAWRKKRCKLLVMV